MFLRKHNAASTIPTQLSRARGVPDDVISGRAGGPLRAHVSDPVARQQNAADPRARESVPKLFRALRRHQQGPRVLQPLHVRQSEALLRDAERAVLHGTQDRVQRLRGERHRPGCGERGDGFRLGGGVTERLPSQLPPKDVLPQPLPCHPQITHSADTGGE